MGLLTRIRFCGVIVCTLFYLAKCAAFDLDAFLEGVILFSEVRSAFASYFLLFCLLVPFLGGLVFTLARGRREVLLT